ncbi:hypothetical protein [Ensifer sp. SL37]|nr:hypothetical protein [Ensifer sp. SL37]MCY1740330.1 hypothetical protein [Ensifer sp. SL37]
MHSQFSALLALPPPLSKVTAARNLHTLGIDPANFPDTRRG